MEKDPISFIRYMSQSIHEEYHDGGSWEHCMGKTCVEARMWIKKFRSEEPTWITATGKVMLIKDMDDAHLHNSYRLIRKRVSTLALEAKEMGLDIDKAKELIGVEFPAYSHLKAEILKRKAAELKKYDGTRNLDI